MWTHLYQVRVTEESQWHDSRLILDTHLQHVAFSFTHAHGGTQCLFRCVCSRSSWLQTLACFSVLLNRARPASIADTRPPTGTIQNRAGMCGRSVTHTHVSTPLPAVHAHIDTHTHTREVLAEGYKVNSDTYVDTNAGSHTSSWQASFIMHEHPRIQTTCGSLQVLETHSRLTGPIKDSWILSMSIKEMLPCMSDDSQWTGHRKSNKFGADPVNKKKKKVGPCLVF